LTDVADMSSLKSEKAHDNSSAEGLLPSSEAREEPESKDERSIAGARLGNHS